MRKNIIKVKNNISVDNDLQIVKSIEEQMREATTTGTPIEATTPLLYTDRKDGVVAAYNIRTDRWELAQDAMDKVAKSYRAKRAELIKAKEVKPTGTDTEGAGSQE